MELEKDGQVPGRTVFGMKPGAQDYELVAKVLTHKHRLHHIQHEPFHKAFLSTTVSACHITYH